MGSDRREKGLKGEDEGKRVGEMGIWDGGDRMEGTKNSENLVIKTAVHTLK